MKRYIDFVASHRKVLWVLFILMMVFAFSGISRIELNSSFDVFMPDDSDYFEVTEEMESYFPGSENILFLIDTGMKEIDLTLMESLLSFQTYLSEHEAIEHAAGPAPEIIMNGRQIIRMNRLDEDDLAGISSYYDQMGSLSPMVTYQGRLYAILEAFPKKGIDTQTIHEIEDELASYGMKYYISGETYMQLKIFDYILRILTIIPPLALFLILLVFRSQMRSLKATLLSVLPAGIGAVWTMGIVGWIGNPISIVTVLAPIFTVVIGSADGLHFVSHVQDEEERKVPKLTALTSTLRMVGIPMIITTITSMAGFLVLLVMNNKAIQSLATFASLGIMLAGIATWFVLPLILTGSMTLQTGRTKRQIAETTKRETIQRLWGRPSIIIVLVLAMASAIGIPRLSNEFSMVSLYKPSTDVQKGFDLAMKVNGGSVPLFLFIEHEGNPLEPESAEAVMAVTDALEERGLIGKVVSGYELMAMMNGALSGSDSEYPDSMKKAQSLYNIISRRADNPITFIMDTEAERTRVIIFPTDLANSTLDEIISGISSVDDQYDAITIFATGAQFLFRELNESIIDGQLFSIILAFVIIYLLLLVSLKDLKKSLVALIPIAVTIVSLYGAMGLIGLSLNLITVTIFGITIGVGIDYAIHFTFVWNEFRKEGLDSPNAAEKAVSYTARPIMANGFGISIGLSALMFSPLLVHVYVAEMMWISMIVSMFLSLTFLPTLLRRLR